MEQKAEALEASSKTILEALEEVKQLIKSLDAVRSETAS
jgi:hypothetical protein